MSFLHRLIRLVRDPAPGLVFELTEAGIAFAQAGKEENLGFEPLEEGVLSISPLRDNVLQPDALARKVRELAGEPQGRKRRRAALILPDYCARVTVLDFDSFPAEPAEQASLVRFRIKKAVPYDVEAAVLQFHPQPGSGNGKKWDVVAALIPMEIVARYEAPFRAVGLHPGFVTTSNLAALGLLPPEPRDAHAVSILAKLSGRVLTVSVLFGSALKMVRCVELTEVNAGEINTILYPTLAYVEDELAVKPAVVYLCGFEMQEPHLRSTWEQELGLRSEPLRSRYGTPGQHRAGLLGYLHSLEEF